MGHHGWVQRVLCSEKDKYYMISLIYSESKKQTKQNKNRLIDTENKWVIAKKTKFGGMSEIKVIGK